MNLARTWGQNTNSPVFIGFAYLSESFHVAPSTAGFGELNLGIILTAKHRRQGFATEALNLIVPYAFAKLNCHRLQASIMTMPEKNRVVKMFTSLGFAHEGTRRRSFFCGMTHEWKDVTTLAMLDSDHALRRDLDLKAPKTLWDELFTRHERERQDLLRWEERTMMEMECNSTSIKRTSSMETIRMPLYTETDVEASGESEAETEDKFMSGPSSPYPSGSGHLPRPDSPTLSEASFTEIHRDHLSGGDLTDSSWSDLSDAPPPSSSDSEADYSDLGDDDDDMSQTQLLARGSGPNKRRRFLI
ncbi:hypothetical protein DL96DRAFT_1461645 [Flagelloscypha sp. PMI_526]|nr:hypothetical protein DL96DRAFT_1461645 [Flagelloscypha sp. PMI_526]